MSHYPSNIKQSYQTYIYVRANLTRVTSFLFTWNSTPRRFPSYPLLTLLLYFLFIFYFPRLCTPLHLFLPWFPYHFYIVIEQRTTLCMIIFNYLFGINFISLFISKLNIHTIIQSIFDEKYVK